jgi:hypothetical protein
MRCAWALGIRVGKREEDFTAEFAEAAEENKESRGEGKGILSQSTLRTARRAGRIISNTDLGRELSREAKRTNREIAGRDGLGQM